MLYHIAAPRKWPDRPLISEEEANEILDRILADVHAVDQMHDPLFGYHGAYERALSEGENPLVISVGWQQAYDDWERRRKTQGPPLPPKPTLGGVGQNNELLDTRGNPIQVRNGERINAMLVTPDGQHVPLNRGVNGELVLPTPSQIQELNRTMTIPEGN